VVDAAAQWRRFGSSGRLLLLGLASISSFAGPALGQPGPPERAASPASSVAITVPELVKFVDAEYPEQAKQTQAEAEVDLVLEIDETGAVSKAEVLKPVGQGFDEAAIAAARQLVFRPARRGERPVKSKIVYRYSFQFTAPPAPAVPQTGSISGRVLIGDTEQPLAGARVTLSGGAGLVLELDTAATGMFTAPSLAPARYLLTISAPGFEPFRVEEALAPGEAVSLVYRLTPLATDATEVVVRGTRPRREVTRRVLSRRELARVPGTSGDALRAIQNLPGVARPPALSGLLVVRGTTDQSTPIFIDGLWFPNIYHFGGISSVVPTEMLDEINFYPGNFGVRYGRATGGVVDAHLRETRDDGRYHGLLQVDLIDVRAMAEGPVPLVKGWNFIGGFRRSHIDTWLIPLIEGGDTQITAAPVYYDYQLIADTRPSPKSYFRIGFLGYDDRFRLVDDASASGGDLEAVNSSLGVGTIFEASLSEATRIDATLSVARFHQRFSQGNILFDTVAHGFVGRSELAHRLLPNATLRTGLDLLIAPYNVNGQIPEEAATGGPDIGSAVTTPARVFDRDGIFLQPAAYAELSVKPSRRAELVSGVRGDYSFENRRFDVSPRLTARYDLVPGARRLSLKGGSGLFHQPPGLGEIVLSDEPKRLRSARAWQNSLGFEKQLTDQVELSVEGFFNLLDNLVTRQPDARGTLRYVNEGTGRIFGAELMLRYTEDDDFFGWVSYTLSRSERSYADGQPSRLFYLDQPHILTVLGSYNLGRGWEVGARFRFTSGNLYTPCVSGLFSSTSTTYLCVNGPELSERVEPFHQLDVRVDKRWVFSTFTLGVYLDLINAYNRINPDFFDYNFDFSRSREQSGSLPIVPSLGVRGEF
jgi:TonB family protein